MVEDEVEARRGAAAKEVTMVAEATEAEARATVVNKVAALAADLAAVETGAEAMAVAKAAAAGGVAG